jgi:hypothetical protein
VASSTFSTEPAKNEFAFADNPLTKKPRRRSGQLIPLHVLNIPTAVADEMVMPHAFGIEPCGAALDGNFTN